MRKANVAFCDGHVELMALPDMGYIVNYDESVAALDPRATNRLFSGSGRDDDPPPVQ
jgi:prepilin-type processing-associated H-X9-DG protein